MERRGKAYYYREQVNGKRRRAFLSYVSDGQSALYRALAEHHKPTANTVSGLLDAYLAEAEVKPVTLKAYAIWAKTLKAVFGDAHPDDLQPQDIARFLELQKQNGKGVTGNRQRAVLSAAYTFGLRRGLINQSPFTMKIARNKETPRRRYVRDEELDAAMRATTPAFRDFLEVAYLTGLRQKDLRELTQDSITDAGIVVEESKTGRRVVIQWSDRLRDAVRRSVLRSAGRYVLVNTRGEPWTTSGLQSAMKRLNVDWTLHDLRAKAESDSEKGLGLLSLYKRDRRVDAVK